MLRFVVDRALFAWNDDLCRKLAAVVASSAAVLI